MAANPLFTGTISSNKQTPIYNTGKTNSVLRQSNINLGHEPPRGTSTPLRKKPRLVCPTDNAMNESDPWQDDMLIDDDFLTACDLAESQATQSHTTSNVDKQTAVINKPVKKINSNINAGHRPHSNPTFPSSAGTSAGNKFSFKPSHRTQPITKQTNIHTSANQNGKLYYQPPSPTHSSGGTPPKSNSQNRARNNSGSSRSRNSSGGSPVKLQPPPNPMRLQQNVHRVQSNVTLTTTSVQQSTSRAQYKCPTTSTKPTWTSATTIGQNHGQSQSIGRTNLTPPAGSVATRESPDLPTATQEGRASQKPNLVQQQMDKMRQELEASQKQLKSLKDERYSKDGEIKVLRQNLAKTKSETSKLHFERVQLEDKLKTQQSNKEKELAKEVEQLRTQLEFKNVELREAQDNYRNLELKRPLPDFSSPFPASSQITPSQVTPPRRSLRVALGSSQTKVDRSPKGGDIFPTQESFMEHSFSAIKKSPKLKVASGSRPRSSPRRMPLLASPDKVSPPPSQTFTPARALCGTPKKQSTSISTAPVLCTRLQKGRSNGTQILAKMLETSTKQNPVDGSGAEAYGRGLLNLFNGDSMVNPGLMAVERTQGRLSPTQTRKRSSPGTVPVTSTAPIHQLYNENEDLAMRSLHTILNPPHIDDLPNYHTNTDSLLGLLPLIEDRLAQYIEAVQNLRSACDSVPSSTNPSTSSTCRTGSVAECSGDSASSSAIEERLIFAGVEASTLSCLQSLRVMVYHCDDVCRTVLCPPGNAVRDDQADMDVSIIEIDPSAPLIDPTQAPGVLERSLSSLHCSKLQLMNKLLRLVSLQKPQQVLGYCTGLVDEEVLGVLAPLAKKADIAELDRFRLMLINDSLSINLLSDSTLERACHTIDIMAGLSKSYELLKRFCNQSDDCQLLHVYQCGLRGIKGNSDSQSTFLMSKVIDLLLTIVTTHNTGATFLLETDCQCSMEVIEAVLFMLLREQRMYSIQNHPNSFALLRQGVMLLHSLMTCADHKLDMEYIKLIVSLVRLFRKHPDTAEAEDHKLDMEYIKLIVSLVRLFRKHPDTAEAEANLLLDLWDFDDDEDEDQQQDMEVES